MRRCLFLSSLSFGLAMALSAPACSVAVAAPTTAKAERPLLKVDADTVSGKIIATFPKPDADGISARYIYLTQLETGLGSAPIGLDRATANETRILVFRRIGKKVAAEVENSDASWATREMRARTSRGSAPTRSAPSIITTPCCGS